MAALCNRASQYIFSLWFLFFFFFFLFLLSFSSFFFFFLFLIFSSPNLSGRRSDVYHTLCWRVWGTQQILAGFAPWQHYCTDFSSARQPNVVALNRGRHRYSPGRPSRWSLAHILVVSFSYCCLSCIYVFYASCIIVYIMTDHNNG